ncbi:MupG family TIM beta-alpha barrel fold protein [uncultured Faecalibaculum sp.]|uniref:MupG family TIM beta-alpha barrel fold protein n=1 Tax=uncultured Faecalibaculum sp. TaxID=1729681 RepID=UPI0025F16002|nr:MupG family TIM beta-alpha barrel fold protein [uncultured Faecalibaculum sp.]
MEKIRLGISLYPEQESREEIEAYLKTASEHGFTKVFTSLFSVDGTKEELIRYFRELTDLAHKYGMVVSGDCNGQLFERLGAKADDLSVFREMGLDILRMDGPFRDERDVILVNNQDGLKIEFNASMSDLTAGIIEAGGNPDNILTCHNFYPQRYTCPSFEAVDATNDALKKQGISTAMFLSSQVPGTHGPWPVSDGLPTVEEHRDIPVESQLKHMIAMKNVTEAIFGNAFASDAEFDVIAKTMEQAYPQVEELEAVDPYFGDILREWLPEGETVRIPLKLHLEEGLSDNEKDAVFSFNYHVDLGDCLNYMLRSRLGRMLYKGREFTPRPCAKKTFEKGDVVLVNDNCKHYAGEVQIVMKPMKNDGQRNLIGHIDEDELMILDKLGAMDIYGFVDAQA